METIAANVDRILGVMVRQGFTVVDANAAYEEVTAVALGSAVMTTRERAAVESGASLRAAHEAVVASHPDHELPYLEALLEEIPRVGRHTLRDRVNTVLRGIAAERGIDWGLGERRSVEPIA